MRQERRDALLREYAEVSNNFRLLTDIQFRLLGLLPVASALTAALSSRSGFDQGVPLSLALLGLVVTLGVVTYHTRNDQLYNALIARAWTIERSLGLPDGAFATRPRAWLYFEIGPWKWQVNHGQGTWTVYSATVVLWLYLTIRAVLSTLAQISRSNDGRYISALDAFALLGTILMFSVGWSIIKAQHRVREYELRKNVRDAVQALQGIDNDLRRATHNDEFLRACTAASSQTNLERVLKFYKDLDPDAMSHYVPSSATGVMRSAFLVSLLTDLPPMWIFDIYNRRRGAG